MMIHYVYKTTCIETGQFYVGVRGSLSPDSDRYIGSGLWIKKAKRKRAALTLRKKILARFADSDAAGQFENEEIFKHRGDPLCMNLCLLNRVLKTMAYTPVEKWGAELKRRSVPDHTTL